MTAAKLATSVTLDRASGELTIDGKPFGYFLAREPITITAGADEMTVVRLPLMVDLDGSMLVDGKAVAHGRTSVLPEGQVDERPAARIRVLEAEARARYDELVRTGAAPAFVGAAKAAVVAFSTSADIAEGVTF